MSKQTLFQSMKQSVVDGEVSTAEELARQALAEHLEPLDVIEQGFKPGLDEVGRGFEAGEYFLPDLMLAGKAMQAAVAIVEPRLQAETGTRASAGKVVLATVQGDLHTIGKDLVGLMLRVNGFEVIDLGCDVPTATIVDRVREERPVILGLSCLLTTAAQAQRDVIEALEDIGIRQAVKVLVGGAATTTAWAEQIGADGYAGDAAAAARKAKEVTQA